MGILDRFKKKAGDLADQHGDQAKNGLRNAGDFADEKTGGKHRDKIDQSVDQATDGIDQLGADAGDKPGTDGR